MLKRMLDLALSAAMVVALSPVMLATAVLVLARFGRPVLFRQIRPGRNGRPFQLVKFRTMTNESDADGHLLPDHLRLPPLGRFLRASSLDELPQLWNVLCGHMSLVGPRPLLMEYLPLYTPDQGRRHQVRPGITGWAQVNGRNGLSWDEKFALDVWYVDNHSIVLDVKILWRTITKVFRREDIAQAGQATMSKFTGSK
jgi:sugar transferase EpsL